MLGWFLFFALPVAIIVVCIIGNHFKSKAHQKWYRVLFPDWLVVGWIALTILAVLFLLVCTVGMICNQLQQRAWIQEFQAKKAVIEIYRGTNVFERAATILQVTELNGKLKREQYWASKPVLRPFYVRELLDVTPISLDLNSRPRIGPPETLPTWK